MSDSVSTNKTMMFKTVTVIIMAVIASVIMAAFGAVNADAATVGTAPKFVAEKTYESDYTHPYNSQTNTIIVHWGKVTNAVRYDLYIAGGQYSGWKKVAGTTATSYKVTGLRRATTYKFTLRAVYKNGYSPLAATQYIKTARMNYDQAGWEAMCRIVYHEVGAINDSMWDKPIVYVSDCVVNRFVCAKYAPQTVWYSYYKRYSTVQQMIYNSGEFMSSAGLSRDGANYSNVPAKVKLAVWGATYAQATYKGIVNDCNVFFWCNRGYSTSSSKIAYSFKIPWGYFYIWRSYWG